MNTLNNYLKKKFFFIKFFFFFFLFYTFISFLVFRAFFSFLRLLPNKFDIFTPCTVIKVVIGQRLLPYSSFHHATVNKKVLFLYRPFPLSISPRDERLKWLLYENSWRKVVEKFLLFFSVFMWFIF